MGNRDIQESQSKLTLAGGPRGGCLGAVVTVVMAHTRGCWENGRGLGCMASCSSHLIRKKVQ